MTTHNDAFTCEIEGCGQVVKTARSLLRHKQTVHKEQFAGLPIVCSCGKQYPRKDHLVRHMKKCQDGRKRKR